MRCTLALAVALGAAGAVTPAAAAAACPAGERCLTVTVPLDRSGAVPGSVRLPVRVVPAAGRSRGLLVALAGGPGQAAVPLAAEIRDALGPGATHYDFAVFDQRGTGGAGVLRCDALSDGDPSSAGVAARCAREIGAPHSRYRTVDSAEDLEAVRAALGAPAVTIYGVSYGTKVAEAYAALHPSRVRALILDSVVPPWGPDPMLRPTLRALPLVLRSLCGHGACRRITADVARDLATLARRMRRRQLVGWVVDPLDGRPVKAALRETDLVDLLGDGDLDPMQRAAEPAAVHAAAHGDPALLLRLAFGAAGVSSTAPGDSDAVFVATSCEELPFPWSRTASAAQRMRQARAAIAAQPAWRFGPFDGATALGDSLMPLCAGWPADPVAPAVPSALPRVPALILSGTQDSRTPYSQARALAARLPGSRVLRVGGAGHAVLAGPDDCGTVAASRFLLGRAGLPACAGHRLPVALVPVPPTSLSRVRAVAGVRGLAGRVLAAVEATVADSAGADLGAVTDGETGVGRGGGLRRGMWRDAGGCFALHGVEYVRGVRVSGRMCLGARRPALRLTIAGPRAVRGSLVAQDRRVSGRIGGHRIRARRAEMDVSVASAVALRTLATADAAGRGGSAARAATAAIAAGLVPARVVERARRAAAAARLRDALAGASGA